MRIAILAPTAGPAFSSEAEGSIGGAERQLAAFGREMTTRGHTVDLLAAEDGTPPLTTPAGTIWPIYPLRGIPLLKLAHPKGTAINRFLRERRSDLILQRGAAELTALAARGASRLGIPFVYCVASDTDLARGAEILPHPQDRLLYRWGLKRADRIVCQTRHQARRLEAGGGRRAVVLHSFPHGDAPPAPSNAGGDMILWGGNIRPIKRPEWLLELADLRPDLKFLVYGGAAPGHDTYADGIAAQLRARANIEYLGPVTVTELGPIFSRCCVLLNTSREEGFPNTFLEAWQRGMPVVATVDPDGLLSRDELGKTGRSISEISQFITDIRSRPESVAEQWRRYALEYVAEHFSRPKIADGWENLLVDLHEAFTRPSY